MTKAARAFARAVQADPAFAQPTIDLARTALAQRIQPRLDVALEAVRLAAASPPRRHPPLQLARGPAGPAGGGGGAFWGAPRRGGGPQSRGAPRRALPALFLRVARVPARESPPPLRHHRALSLRPGGVRRPRHHLSAPRAAGQAGVVSAGARPYRAERDVAVPPPPTRGRPDLPLRRARRRAGLQAGGEPGRRAHGRARRRADPPGAAPTVRPGPERLVRVPRPDQPRLRSPGQHPPLDEHGPGARRPAHAPAAQPR